MPRSAVTALAAAGLGMSLVTAGAVPVAAAAAAPARGGHHHTTDGHGRSADRAVKAPRDIVDLARVDRTIRRDIRYFTAHNFVGEPIDGYEQPRCLLTRKAARALARVQRDVRSQGYTLKVYDCYRPQQAVNHFVEWARVLGDTQMKAEFYPNVDKTRLFADGYIAEKSGHSRASTVDLTLVKLPAKKDRPWQPRMGLQPCFAPVGQRFADTSIDMGTGYDCFDTLSHTADPRITPEQRANRRILVEAMDRQGFRNLPEEWWHFTLRDEPYPNTYFDFPVSRRVLRH